MQKESTSPYNFLYIYEKQMQKQCVSMIGGSLTHCYNAEVTHSVVLWLQNEPKSSLLHCRAWQLTWGVCVDMLRLAFVKRDCASRTNISTLVSPVQRTLLQKSFGLSRSTLAKPSHTGFLLATFPNKPYLFSLFLTVMLWPLTFNNQLKPVKSATQLLLLQFL